MDVFQFVMNSVEKVFPDQLSYYLKDHVNKNRHEVKDGIEVWNGNFVDKRIYTFGKKNYIKTLGHKICLDGEILIYNEKCGEQKHLISKKEMYDIVFESIKWVGGRSDTCKNMMIGDYKAATNIMYDTFCEKRELIVSEIVENIIK